MRARVFSLIFSIRVVGLLLAALAIWAFSEIAEEVLEKESAAIDKSILLTIRLLHTPLLDQIMLGITFMGDPSVLLVACLVLGIWLLYRRYLSQATTLALVALGAVGLNYLLKVTFGRARPQLWERVVDVGQYSFPSGHAMVSMVIYGYIGYVLATKFRRWGAWILSLTVLLVISIGFSRLYLGVHWPTDIVAGYAAGLVWLITCVFSVEVWRQYRASRGLPEEEEVSLNLSGGDD